MAGSVNKVILVGNLGRDPEGRTTQGGTKVVTFSLATSETWKDQASGEKRERVQWHRVVIWNERIGEVAERYLKKGSKVYIEGALESRKYTDQAGAERETTEVVLRQFRGELTLLGDPPGEGGRAAGGGAPKSAGSASGASAYAQASGRGSVPPRRDELDDDIPF